VAVLIALTAACSADVSPPVIAVDAAPQERTPEIAKAPPVPAANKWTFAVLSDLHLPNPKEGYVDDIVAALIAMHVRLVVITGDHTNGNAGDHKRSFRGEGWTAVRHALQPLHDAGIAVLPVAGNHDTYAPWQIDEYAQAFRDLEYWAAPLAIEVAASGGAHGRAPFSYSVDVDGVHFSLVHLVAQSIEPDVARWLAADLQQAANATQRIVFGHVPMSSVIRPPHSRFVAQLGAILEAGHATMHVAGHEHVVWDEDVTLPGGSSIREVLVGCASGLYIYGPSEREQQRAHCTAIATRRGHEVCRMPHGGGAFELVRRAKNTYVATRRTAFTLFDVDGSSIDVRPMTLDASGQPVPFYFNP
jgi:predicted phosphodiesterase